MKSTSQIHVVRPRWIGRPATCTVPSVTGRMKVVLFDWPTAILPSSDTTMWVAADASVSAIAA